MKRTELATLPPHCMYCKFRYYAAGLKCIIFDKYIPTEGKLVECPTNATIIMEEKD